MKYFYTIIVFCFVFGDASAAFISATPFGTTGVSLHLLGGLKSGDLEKLQFRYMQVLERLPNPRGSPAETFLFLDSPGGDVREALAIGRWVRKIGMTVTVLPTQRCYSSCVYVLASGLYRHPDGEIGIHRPYLTASPSGGIDAAMKDALRASKAYFSSMNIAPQLAEAMFSVPPDNLKLLDERSIAMYRLDQVDLSHQEALDLKNAAYYGLSRQKYMERKMRATVEIKKCSGRKGLPYYECWVKANEQSGLYRPESRPE